MSVESVINEALCRIDAWTEPPVPVMLKALRAAGYHIVSTPTYVAETGLIATGFEDAMRFQYSVEVDGEILTTEMELLRPYIDDRQRGYVKARLSADLAFALQKRLLETP